MPGKKSEAVRALRNGETISDLGEVSGFESSVYFNDSAYQSPWIKVKTIDNQTGWVLGAAVRPVAGDPAWLFQKRIKCYFGESIAGRRNRLIGQIQNGYDGRDEEELAAGYRACIALRDTMVGLLARRAEPNEAGFQPDFSWLAEALPGFIFQRVAEGTQPYLFADYRFWRQKSLETEGKRDDLYFSACLAAFPADSIESFFPAWKFQLSDYEAASQLGAGAHLDMFSRIEVALSAGELFKPELMAFKESLMEDIFEKNIVYWQPKDLILKEINQIYHSNFTCLSKRERAALQTRVDMFADPEANGIKVNLRSGEGL